MSGSNRKQYDMETEQVRRIDRVHEEKHYEVWVVKVIDMPTAMYGIINKKTSVIESFQPVFYNAKTLAKDFSAWLDGEKDPKESLLKAMLESTEH